ncbi:MAG: hypothetical protein E7037_07075 [Verrucomicrobia bacterium]|nr:hypothetical protein [Verrucomicrobiota bacterium]
MISGGIAFATGAAGAGATATGAGATGAGAATGIGAVGLRNEETCSGFGGNAAAIARPTAATTTIRATAPTKTQPTTPQLTALKKG